MTYLALTARCLTGIIFTVSAMTKLRNRTAFRSFALWVAQLPVPFARRRVTPMIIALSEVAIVALVAVGPVAAAGLVLAALTLGVFAVGAALAVRQGVRTSCQCFGTSQSSLGVRHVVRDVVLAAFAAVAVAGVGPNGVRPDGIAFSVGVALAAAVITFFLDDLTSLFSDRDRLQSG